MKVLYLGVYRDVGGWSRAALDYVLALDSAGVDVVPRPIKLDNANVPLPKRMLELEAKSSEGCDVVIQHVLPHQMEYRGGMKNIGLFASETSDFRASTWAERLNLMDEVWVINRQQVSACRLSGVTQPIRVIPHATNIERFQQSYEPLEILVPYREQGRFLFYFVGETVRRKNLAALLKAFHTEFDLNEPVELVIKTNKSGVSPDELKTQTVDFCNQIKRGLKLYGSPDLTGYHQEIILTNRLSEKDMMRLHASCDCFVMPSYGEAWSIPTMDAMGMGNTPIVTGFGGFLDYMNNEAGWLVDWHEEPVFGIVDSIQDLFTGHETWAAINVGHLRRCMRAAYGSESIREEKAIKGLERAYDFSYQVVGQRMLQALSDP